MHEDFHHRRIRRRWRRGYEQIITEVVLFAGQDMDNIDETYPYPKTSFVLVKDDIRASPPIFSLLTVR